MTELHSLARRGVERWAVVDATGRYRYELGRRLPPVAASRSVLFVMLNPSTADGTVDDPTIRRCWGFARRFGCDELLVGNLYALRATDPAVLRAVSVEQAIGPENGAHMARLLARSPELIVCAWGALGAAAPMVVHRFRVLAGARPLSCLGLTKDGSPKHPLYLAGDAPLLSWPGGASVDIRMGAA